ncbi:MAG: hypothetical protein M5U09_05555 [Gammaproteobacteria bacterium]|nr:hypothetical protein [Gammaproteobacteria bacterium]
MRQHHVGDLVIVDNRGGTARPVGIVTDRISSWKCSPARSSRQSNSR